MYVQQYFPHTSLSCSQYIAPPPRTWRSIHVFQSLYLPVLISVPGRCIFLTSPYWTIEILAGTCVCGLLVWCLLIVLFLLLKPRVSKREQICQLEDGHKAFAFSTGMAALSAVTRLVRAGQEIILNNDSYGGTYRLLSKVKNPSPPPPPLYRCLQIIAVSYCCWYAFYHSRQGEYPLIHTHNPHTPIVGGLNG